MCTVILAHHVFDEWPWLVAANRDERLDRPAEGPRVRNDRDIPVMAPVDLQEGGTWMGVNASGVLAALTNRFGAPRDGGKTSRGQVVFDALAASDSALAARRIRSLDPVDFNPFHLLTADPDGAHLVWSDGESMTYRELEPGVHVVTERSFDAAANARQTVLEGQIADLIVAERLSMDALVELLSVRRQDDMDATCVYIPDLNYGTRSATVAAIGDSPVFRYWDGAPCDVEFEDLSSTFDALVHSE